MTIRTCLVACAALLMAGTPLAELLPMQVNTQYEDLGERRFSLRLVATGGTSEDALAKWRESAGSICGNPNWLGEPASQVAYRNDAGQVERVLDGRLYCLTGFEDSRRQGSDEQFHQLREQPLSVFNFDVRTPLYDLLKEEDFQGFMDALDSIVSEFHAGELTEHQVSSLYNQVTLNDPALEPVLEALVDAYPGSAVARLLLARIYRDIGWDFRSNNFWFNVPEDDGTQFRQYMKRARSQIDRARELDPDLPLVWAESINIYKGLGSTDEELGTYLFEQSLAHQPGSLATHVALFSYLEPKWHGSREHLSWLVDDTKRRYHINPELKALEALKTNFEGWRLYQRGLMDQARSKYREALEEYRHPTILRSLSNIALYHNELELAEDYTREAMQYEPLDADAYATLMDIAREQKTYLEAMRLAYAAAMLDKQAVDPLYFRAHLFMYYRRYEDALETLEMLRQRKTDNDLYIQQLMANVRYQLSIRDESL